MAKQFACLTAPLMAFIEQQKIYFVGTATADSRVNISPKGMDSLRILSENQVAWLNVTGSGNESAAHIPIHPRMTIMFCAFTGAALILRLYGQARVIHKNDADWDEYYSLFTPLPAARQIFVLTIDLVQTSCGLGTPYFDYVADREDLNNKHIQLGEAKIEQYWMDKNQLSIDGLPTYIAEKNLTLKP